MRAFAVSFVATASLLLAVLLLISHPSPSSAVNNGLGHLPILGWNTWCTNGACARDVCNTDEILDIAQAIVDSGMRDLGYNYINLDDCWGGLRDAQDHYAADPARFPPAKDGTSGMKILADKLHSMGLKFGLYTDGGKFTCNPGGRPYKIPGSFGHFEDDAKTFAEWGMDYVKMDWCNSDGETPESAYRNMSHALNATGRPIFFETCEWGVDSPSQWMRNYANAWRSGMDHHDDWGNTYKVIENSQNLENYAGCFADGKGCGWNYLDFLMTGGAGCPDLVPGHRCPGMTDDEYRTEAAIWTIVASPLIVATDIRNMSSIQREILLNTELLAIHQDNLAKAGGRVSTWDNCLAANVSTPAGVPPCQIWARPLENGEFAIVLYNADSVVHNVSIPFRVVGWPNSAVGVRNVYKHQDEGVFEDVFETEVAGHGVFFGRISCKGGDCQ